jgi:putative DNA methylase
MTPVKTRKKLIEVALPLEAINKASVREGYIYRGNPSALHKWWAQRPLAAARAVIFAQMVDDPSEYVDVLLGNTDTRRAAERELKKRKALYDARAADVEPGPPPRLEDCAADLERQRLFRLIEDLVQWGSITNEAVLEKAREEIWVSWRRACAYGAGNALAAKLFERSSLPPFSDPFSGSGTLPIEAQRLGLNVHAGDLNPVAVVMTKAAIEIPPRFSGRMPVNPEHDTHRHWKVSEGLADDVRYYGQRVRQKAERRLGHLYPEVEITADMMEDRPDLKPYLGRKLPIIAWLWARTVRSPNPAFAQVAVPLASTFILSSKPGKEAWVEPSIKQGGYRFIVRMGKPKKAEEIKRGTKAGGSGSSFLCLMSGAPMPFSYVRDEAKSGGMGARLMAMVVEGERGRIYLTPTAEQEAAAREAVPDWKPEIDLPAKALGFRVQEYGMTRWSDLFTDRQITALTTFSDIIVEVMAEVRADALAAGFENDPTPLSQGGTGALAYSEAVATYLAFAIDKTAEYGCTIVPWYAKEDRPKGLFARHAIPMVWDFAEVNPLGDIGGTYSASTDIIAGALSGCAAGGPPASAEQVDAVEARLPNFCVVSTDPPYYDNIGYSDLSDFFYIWQRRSLRSIFPEIFATLAVPKKEELIASPYRHGGREKAEAFFLDGMTQAMTRLTERTHPAFPVTIYYAFKQSETENDVGTASTGWETFLDAVIRAGFGISGTWPMRTERGSRSIGLGTNALASSIVLVCRPRPADAPTSTRREFLAALKAELPNALRNLQKGNIAPVDLAQAAIGPGMAVFTRYARVLDAEGKALSVREALALINATLDEVLAEQEGDFDADSRWALAWFEQHGFAEGEYGVAEVLSKAKVTSVAGLAEAGIVESRRGKVRLLPPAELPEGWDPATDPRLSAWEVVHQLIRALEAGGEAAAAALVARLGARAEVARELAYRLYVIAERKKRAAEAQSYNALVQSWPEITRLAREGAQGPARDLFEAAGG